MLSVRKGIGAVGEAAGRVGVRDADDRGAGLSGQIAADAPRDQCLGGGHNAVRQAAGGAGRRRERPFWQTEPGPAFRSRRGGRAGDGRREGVGRWTGTTRDISAAAGLVHRDPRFDPDQDGGNRTGDRARFSAMSKGEGSIVAGPALSPEQIRIKALTRFAISITALNLLGHTVLGFETSFLQLIVTVATTYTAELVLQAIDDWSQGRRPAFMGNGFHGLVMFLLPAHITGFAISMLLFAHDELLPYVLAGTAAITSKAIFTVTVRGKPRHFLNPSNMGLVASILLYTKIGLAPPYQFTEHLAGLLYVILPCFILYTRSLLNRKP